MAFLISFIINLNDLTMAFSHTLQLQGPICTTYDDNDYYLIKLINNNDLLVRLQQHGQCYRDALPLLESP